MVRLKIKKHILQYKQCGNTVVVPVVKQIAKNVVGVVYEYD